MRLAGLDATDPFDAVHDDKTLLLASKYAIGILENGSHVSPVTQNVAIKETGTVMEKMAASESRCPVKQCTATELRQLNNVLQIEQEYIERAPPALALHINYGAEDDESVKISRDAWSNLRLRPRFLRDTTKIDLSISILGHRMEFPVGISPFAVSKASHPDGELALARASRELGCSFCVPHFGNTPLEDIAKEAVSGAMAASSPLMLQLYLPRTSNSEEDRVDRALCEKLMAHAKQCGCVAVVVTVDTTVDGNRERTYLSTQWMKDIQEQMGGLPKVCTMNGAGAGPYTGHSRSLCWDDIAWLCKNEQGLPIMLKGVISPEEAAMCCDPGIGLSGIFVSNHGGRQLDGCEAPADVLGEICDVVAGRMPVIVDGGIRRGKDVFRALALGATAAFIGRPAHWGLGLGGQAGVERVLQCLREELQRVMILSGCPSLADISRAHVRHIWQPMQPPVITRRTKVEVTCGSVRERCVVL
jgi:isopentenyl diphosphate isomerase/L-lactate dehydrogenase-like FMN-dependent dehydrogenase